MVQAIVFLTALLALLPGGVLAQGDDNCPGAVLNCNTCVTGTTLGYNDDHDCGEGHDGPDIAYQFSLVEGTHITLIGEAEFDADWTLATTCDTLTSDLGCFDWTEPHADPSCGSIVHVDYGYLNFSTFLDPGTYYLWIDGFYVDSAGNYSIELICDSIPTPVQTLTPTPSVPGDHCDNVIDISSDINLGTFPLMIPGDSSGATNYYSLASCSFDGATGPELVYSFTPDTSRNLTFDLCTFSGTIQDSVIYIRYEGPCPGSLEMICDDDNCTTSETDLRSITSCRQFLAGITYYLSIDTNGGTLPGTFLLNVENCEIPTCNPGNLYGQNPHFPEDLWTALISDQSTTENLSAYENFSIMHNNICSIQWWGFTLLFDGVDWFSCSKSVSYQVNFYQNTSGQPGALMASRTVTPILTPTGIFYGSYELMSCTASFAPCIMADTAWVSIQAMVDTEQPECWFYWMSSGSGDSASYQWDGMNFIENTADLSLCLNSVQPTHTPVPPTMTPIIPTSTPGLPTSTPVPAPTSTPTSPVPTITPTVPPLLGDNCPGIPLTCNTCITGSTLSYLNDHDCGEGHEGPDIVYQVTIAVDSNITIIGEADFDADWTLATTCDYITGDFGCFDWTEPHTNPSCGTITHDAYGYIYYSTFLTAGIYYLWIDGFYNDSRGNYTVEVLCDSSPTAIPSATTTPSVPGDHCDNAIDISSLVNMGMYPVTISGDSSMATNYYALAQCSFNGADGPEIIYSFTPDINRTLAFDLCATDGSLTDSVIYIRTDGPCPGNTEVVCDDDNCPDITTDLLSKTACREYTAGNTYYLFIDTYSGSAPGTFSLNINSCLMPQCTLGSISGQNPHSPEDFWTAYASDQSAVENFKVYESMNFNDLASICGIQWWGFLLENIAGEWITCSKSVEFSIELYSDAGGQPGMLLGNYSITPQMTDAGSLYSGIPLIAYTADLTPCMGLSEGWISIQAYASTGSPNCMFFWMSSPAGDTLSYQWDGLNLVPNPTDVSICVQGSIATQTPISTMTPTVTITPTNTEVPPTFTQPPPTYTQIPPTSSPTDSPTSTPTNTQSPPTYTPIPATSTPSFTPSTTAIPPSATPSFTNTPSIVTNTPTTTSAPPTLTPASTDTPILPTETPICSELGTNFDMPAHFFSPGMTCSATVTICNPGEILNSVPLFVVLDIYGQFFFYPSWCEFPNICPEGDFKLISTVPTGITVVSIFEEFIWPQVVSNATNLYFYSAMVDLNAGYLIGSMSSFNFGYGS